MKSLGFSAILSVVVLVSASCTPDTYQSNVSMECSKDGKTMKKEQIESMIPNSRLVGDTTVQRNNKIFLSFETTEGKTKTSESKIQCSIEIAK